MLAYLYLPWLSQLYLPAFLMVYNTVLYLVNFRRQSLTDIKEKGLQKTAQITILFFHRMFSSY